MVKKIISILLMCSFFVGCYQYKIYKPQNSGFNNQLKLGGFYFTSINPKTKAVQKNFLYENGIILNMMAFDSVDLTDLTNQIHDFNKYSSKNKKNYLTWGVFELENKSISITKWYPSSGGPLDVFTEKGVVLNDSTFIIQWYESRKGKKIKDLNEVYHFQKFSPKPDSVNYVIK